jgi:hypothetical protein
MHLDMGQRDFHLSKCAVCGLVYAKGEESDEKTHAAYHTSATKGLRYQPWPNERTLLVDGSSGRVVLVPCGDARPKKVRRKALCLPGSCSAAASQLASMPVAPRRAAGRLAGACSVCTV